ncbi:MAG: hypothetical protein R2789_11785 [Microthrixaceae bacterium]
MRCWLPSPGGVDSSVAAVLLEEGHEVVGATMKLGWRIRYRLLFGERRGGRRSAAQLGIDHHVFNYTTTSSNTMS